MSDAVRLTHEQDGALRRLHFFERCGAELSTSCRLVKQELRARDHRADVREPWEVGVTSAR